jgi:hypothetical protein
MLNAAKPTYKTIKADDINDTLKMEDPILLCK